jgi:uncharacterized protein (DUF4415 family)
MLMKSQSTKTSSPKRLKISDRTHALYEQRDKSLDDTDAPVLPPEMWENAVIGKYYRPVKTAISLRIDADVLAWLKSKGEGHISRINQILREAMLADQRSR